MKMLTEKEVLARLLADRYMETGEKTVDGVWAFDADEGREFNFRFAEKVFERNTLDSMFELNTLKVNKDLLYQGICSLDPNLFSIVNNIVFINNKRELRKYLSDNYEWYAAEDFDNCVGRMLRFENVIIININNILWETMKIVKADPSLDFEDEALTGIWMTIIHELRHSMYSNPIISKEELPIEESTEEEYMVEQYAVSVFESKIRRQPWLYCFDLKRYAERMKRWLKNDF